MFALENGRYTVAAGATSLIRACLDASVKYARERKAFGVATPSASGRTSSAAWPFRPTRAS